MDWTDSLSPYLLIQRRRLGLRPEQIREVQAALEAPWEEIRDRARRFLTQRYSLGSQDPFSWLAQQPVMSKERFREEAGNFRPEKRNQVEPRKTSGSTGVPLRFLRDRTMSAWMEATALALYGWHGQRPWVRQARFWGSPIQTGSRIQQGLKDRILGRRRLNAFQINDEACRSYFTRLRGFRATHAYGYPSLISEFVTRCSVLGLEGEDLGFQAVITTGEPLFPHVRSQLRDFFQCPVVNEYGCSESGVIAFECEEGTLHLTPMAAWIETFDPESVEGEPSGATPEQAPGGASEQAPERVPEPVVGRAGTVGLTDLHGRTAPLIRYLVGDRMTVRPELSCSCGRSLPTVDLTAGRAGSFILLPSGKRVYSAILAYAVPASVRRFRAQQVSPTSLQVMVEMVEGHAWAETVESYRGALEKALDGEISVSMERVDSIPRDPSGKLRYFVPL